MVWRFAVPVVQWEVRLGYAVEARDGELGRVTELFEGPAESIFVSLELYMRVRNAGQPDLFIPYTEIVDISEVKETVYLKRFMREINALRWTKDPRQPAMVPPPYAPKAGCPSPSGPIPTALSGPARWC